MNAGDCYKLLCQLSSGALSRITGIPGDTAMMKTVVGDIQVTVISRDLRNRPRRIGLMTAIVDQTAVMPLRSIAAEVQLYHEYQIAVPLALQEGARSYSAFDQSGRLLASRLVELTETLGNWLHAESRIPVANHACKESAKRGIQ